MQFLLLTLTLVAAVTAAPSSEVNNVEPAHHTIDFDHFWTYDEIVHFLQDIVIDFPNLAEYQTIGTTAEGRQIAALKITNRNVGGANKPTILIEAGASARDWLAVMSTLGIINEFTDHAYAFQNMLDRVEWLIVPVSNPDGYVYSHTTDRAWIKNRRVNAGSNCVGVNIDRNYDCHWGEDGSSTDPCSNVFAGTGPDSEPEAEAISRQVRNYGNRLIVSVSLQSFGSRILYPMAHSSHHRADNFDELLHVASEISLQLFTQTSSFYSYGNIATIAGLQAGTAADFVKMEMGRPLSYVFQVPAGGPNGYDYPVGNLNPILDEIFIAFGFLGNYIAEHY